MSAKNVLLVLCHSKIPYIAQLAKINKNCNFYIHVDAKSNLEDVRSDFDNTLSNVFWLENRVDINWGGFSILQAIFNLIEKGLENPENMYFHLISGNCVFLKDIDAIAKDMSHSSQKSIFIEMGSSLRRRYRIRFNVPHADTKIQRSLLGKVTTKIYQYLDKIFPPKSSLIKSAPFGNMWFSANRDGLVLLNSLSTQDDKIYFKKKLVPDEHFFQFILSKNNRVDLTLDNHRYINFIGTANHPEMLSLENLLQIDTNKYWIARKVHSDVALSFLAKNTK